MNVPDDLKLLYESDTEWPSKGLTEWADANRIPCRPWENTAQVVLRRSLIERIAALEAQVERLSAPVTDGKYFIITKAHEAIWPRGVILFWGPNKSGYSTTLELAGRYTKSEAEAICNLRPQSGNPLDFMVPCEIVEKASRRIVDVDQTNAFLAARKGAA